MIVRYRFWNKIRNCGDAITAYLLQNVLNLSPVTVPADQPHLLATGSIFFLANRNSYIWGSGMLHPEAEFGDIPSANIRAVRGKKTLALLQSRRKDVGQLPLGDPGILVDYLYKNAAFRSLPVKYRAAVIPHHRSINTLPIARGRKDPEICIVDMRDSSLLPLEQIQQSEVVISQSLHGLVFASALNKPYVWVSDKQDERWTFKFEDWFTTVDNPQRQPLPADSDLASLIAKAERRPIAIETAALIKAFPADETCAHDDAPVLDFMSCRALPVACMRCDWLGADDTNGDSGSLSDPQRRAISFAIRKAVQRQFGRWAEMPYVLVAPHRMDISRIDMVQLAEFMDGHVGVDALIVVPAEKYPAKYDFTEDPHLSMPGLKVSATNRFLGGAILLRPGAPFAFRNDIFTALI
jgi:hypothetical protein